MFKEEKTKTETVISTVMVSWHFNRFYKCLSTLIVSYTPRCLSSNKMKIKAIFLKKYDEKTRDYQYWRDFGKDTILKRKEKKKIQF